MVNELSKEILLFGKHFQFPLCKLSMYMTGRLLNQYVHFFSEQTQNTKHRKQNTKHKTQNTKLSERLFTIV